jgi:cytochrome P450
MHDGISNESTQTAGDGELFSLFFTPEGTADPNPHYHRLRDLAPVHRSGTGVMFLTRYDDCREVLRDNRFGKSMSPDPPLIGNADPELVAYRTRLLEQRASGPSSMLFLNPPDHTRQRGLVSRVFTPKRVEQMRADIGVLAEECFDAMAEAGSADALELLGFPLPAAVVGKLIGVPREDWPSFRTLVSTAAVTLEPSATLADLKAAEASYGQMFAYFVDLVAERQARPQDDLLSAMLAVADGDDTLSPEECIATCLLLFSAGFETTTNLIGNGLGALFRNPDQLSRLWADPSLVPSAVEEMLRWDSPVQLDARAALEPADIAGEAVAEGQRVFTLLGAANRDPAHFVDPDRFDVGRDDGPPLSFASGIHFCLGANLARAEGQEVFAGLIRRFASIELDGDLVQRPRMTLRGYQAVPVRVNPR